MKIWNGKYLLVRRDGTVPAWCNLAYVLGPRDPATPIALRAIANHAMEESKNPDLDYVQSLLDRADECDRYREQHGAGDPKSHPWRTEAHDVMSALAGNNSVIVALPDKDNSHTSPPAEQTVALQTQTPKR